MGSESSRRFGSDLKISWVLEIISRRSSLVNNFSSRRPEQIILEI